MGNCLPTSKPTLKSHPTDPTEKPPSTVAPVIPPNELVKKGKFNPDEYFNPLLIEEDKNVFCLKFINTLDQIKLMNNNHADYVVCDDELYVKIT